jgi:hypothetical protein
MENIQLRDSVFWQLATSETSIILGAYAATINFVMYVRPSVRMEQLGSLWTICRENSSFINIGLYIKTDMYFFMISPPVLLRMRKTFQTKAVENIETHILCSFFPKIVPFVR